MSGDAATKDKYKIADSVSCLCLKRSKFMLITLMLCLQFDKI